MFFEKDPYLNAVMNFLKKSEKKTVLGPFRHFWTSLGQADFFSRKFVIVTFLLFWNSIAVQNFRKKLNRF